MTTRIIIVSIMLAVVAAAVPSLSAQTSSERKLGPNSQKAVDLFDAGIKALEAGDKPQALTHFDEMVNMLTPQVALDLLAVRGPKAFDRLFLEGGEFAKIARVVSETASAEVFKQNTDPAQIKQLVEDFLTNDIKKSAEAFQKLKYDAGEFAVPQLLAAWRTAPDIKTKATITIALRQMGSRVSMPLATLLQKPDAPLQLAIIDVFKETREWRMAPALKALAADESQPESVRKAAGEIADKIVAETLGDDAAKTLTIAQLYTMVAEDYLAQRTLGIRAVIPSFVLGEYKRVFLWNLEDGTPAPTEIAPYSYNEELAISMARSALKHDPDYAPAYAVLVAAHFAETAEGSGMIQFDALNRGALLTPEERDLIKKSLEDAKPREAWVFAGGRKSLFEALALTLKHQRRFAAMLCMDQIADTADPEIASLLPRDAEQAADPKCYTAVLASVLESADKQIAYKAAITLARIAGDAPFYNSNKVAFNLVNAMQAGGTVNALVVHKTQQARNAIQATLRSIGCVTDSAADYETGLRKATTFPLPDFIVLSTDLAKDSGKFIVALRDNDVTKNIPILIVSTDLERDKKRFDFPVVKGFITDYNDADQITRLAEGLKKANGYETNFNEDIILEAAETTAAIRPDKTAIDLAAYAEPLLAMATGAAKFEIRKAAIAALGHWRIVAALPALAKSLADKAVPTEVKLIAAKAVGEILSTQEAVNDEVFGLLKAALQDDNESVRKAIGEIFLLASLSTEQKAQLLQ